MGGADGASLYLPSPLSNVSASKVPGPKLGPCPEVASLREASVGPLLFLPASQMVFWSYTLDAVTKVRLGQSLCEVGMFSLYYKVRLAVKGPLDRLSTSEPTPAPLPPRS